MHNSFRPVNLLVGLLLLRQGRILFFELGHLDLSAHQKPDGRDQPDFTAPVYMMLAMLQVYHTHDAAAAHQRHRQECLVTILWEFVEKLKAGIERGLLSHRNRFLMLRDPPGDALPHAEFQPTD